MAYRVVGIRVSSTPCISTLSILRTYAERHNGLVQYGFIGGFCGHVVFTGGDACSERNALSREQVDTNKWGRSQCDRQDVGLVGPCNQTRG